MRKIAGFVGTLIDDDAIHKLSAAMTPSGQFSNNVFRTHNCCLIHSGSKNLEPPKTLEQDGEIYTVVFNGEIFNSQEIRYLLKTNGHDFSDLSDEELILHAFSHWHEGCVEKFNGNFSFAIWMHKRKKLFLARDRLGVKPLFYKLHYGGIIFASETKTILQYPNVKAEVDAEGIAEIVLLGPGRIPGSGIYKGIQELKPGCIGYYQCKKWHWQRYWKLKDREHTDNFEETAEKVRSLLLDSIKRQMQSEKPIGTMLSGGLDSSIITAVCASEIQSRGEQLATFSVNYKDHEKYFVPGKFQPNSDNDYIQFMQEYQKTAHHWTVLEPEQLSGALVDVTEARGFPGMADIDCSLLLFCKDIKQHVDTVLSGECADEIFGGYPWYRDPAIRAQSGFPWSQNIQHRATFLNDAVLNEINPVEYINDQYHSAIAECDIMPEVTGDERRIKELVNLNQNWFMQTLLERNNRMAVYHNLNIRAPFCDYRIAEYLYGVPWEYKEHNGCEKGLLRFAMSDYLPEKILNRKKSPYPKTHDPEYLQLVTKLLQALLSRDDAPIFSFIKKKSLEDLLHRDEPWPWYGQLMRTPQTIAYMLQINIWLEQNNVNIV